MAYDQLRLENQLCFPLYALSRLVIREYQPHLDRLGITYPQYLVFMVLWEATEEVTVNAIAKKLLLNTNTVTPLLKRMEKEGYILRRRSPADERKVLIELTDKGRALEGEAAEVPGKLAARVLSGPLTVEELAELKNQLCRLVDYLDSGEERGAAG